ncbi:hypothetical protein ABB37_07112 [Leptomonas pyrrhocoris]|uniref:Uncharacterized protein n=1 Tax=Leptomonas pyrrhocoris TaxID=157538 RepID=A0A0N0DTB7_LEPPY|nr:hypothetical protein ABB37_07112 [Leptomonas pyrrhocoris]XP_015655637.1 hypothetical protein ABB37_07112 [Leptomonas pyrrhocoris]KPA77197.1 hypothetical protein ABB37_07112 [Leptomonas pyrrhocoris]KPA77198.1 hypothetical protein ABB37_07112 [Leptomonas pyrrhocoris]|eukprot:XP_015655636.1 hypothetical protein ABB37_07112 [Leptomonas pyrrhocoris]
MSSADESESAPDAAAIAALELLETARARLHDALREAAFDLVAAQREEESTRGCLVSLDAVPTQGNTLTPLLTVAQEVEEGNEEPPVGQARSSTWVLTEGKGERISALPARRAAPKASSEAARKETKDDVLTLVDPIYYFSANPSSALRDGQAAYRRAVQCVVEVANAQQRALAAAEAYACAEKAAS